MENKETVKQWLLKQKLQNYGYDYKWFRKMGALKSRMKTKLRNTPDAEIRKALAKEGILGQGRRLTRSKGRVDYTTGQSFNEEMLNMMTLGATKGKKSFYQIQDRWWD
jgi:hypothetical protein